MQHFSFKVKCSRHHQHPQCLHTNFLELATWKIFFFHLARLRTISIVNLFHVFSNCSHSGLLGRTSVSPNSIDYTHSINYDSVTSYNQCTNRVYVPKPSTLVLSNFILNMSNFKLSQIHSFLIPSLRVVSFINLIILNCHTHFWDMFFLIAQHFKP